MEQDFETATNWMILSPWWLAKAMADTLYVNTLSYPVLDELGQGMMNKYDLMIPRETLGPWLDQFRFIN